MALPAHPFKKTTTRQLVVGGVYVAFGAFVAATLSIPLGVTFLLIGATLVSLNLKARRELDALILNNSAFDLTTRGRLTEAETLLASVNVKTGNVRRAVLLQRALIALRKGDAAKAEADTSALLATPPTLLSRSTEIAANVNARAARALARAMLGKEAEAREDIAGVRAANNRSADAVARAAVAEAVLLAKKEDHEGLAASVRASMPLMDWMPPRERALMRAFRRMSAVRGRGSVYRESARVIEVQEEPLLGDWVGKIVPQAAAFVPEAEHREATDAFVVAPAPANTPMLVKAAPKNRRAGRVLALWVLLVVLFLTIWQFLTPTETTTPSSAGRHADVPPADVSSMFLQGLPMYLLCGALLALYFSRIARAVRVSNKGNSDIRHALLLQASGDHAGADRELATLSNSKVLATAASGFLYRSHLAERACNLSEALALVDAGLQRIHGNATMHALNSDILVPELLGQRAYVLAAMGSMQDANTTLGILAREHPSFAYMTRAVFRVRLVQALRQGDIAGAVEVARERTPELPLNRRDETLADIVLALSGGKLAPGELERLESELAEDRELAAWVDFMAPNARGELSAKSRTRIHAPDPSAGEELEPIERRQMQVQR